MGKGSHRARREREGHIPLDVARARTGIPTRQSAHDGEWMVRPLGPAAKGYRCPGCDQLIRPGEAHTVVWPADDLFGEEAAVRDRRHWHPACWRERGRRR
ncbi:MAG: hypothetical protein FWD59_05775 [Micrococcales bacterium]|nr:hypothetical protein [Micrococcales bacterium]